MFFDTNDFAADNIEVYKLLRHPYRQTSDIRPFHAISFRIYGDATYEMGDDTITAEKGDVLFVPAYVQYTKQTQEELFYVIHFKTETSLGNKLKTISPRDPNTFLDLFERIYNVQKDKKAGFEYEMKHLFYKLLMYIEREYVRGAAHRAENMIEWSIQIINESFTDPEFSIASVAKSLKISETYFRRQFQKYKGTSPKQYVSELRLQLARRLLGSGYYSVCEVAERCGFDSAYYFSSFIKRMTGKSPRELSYDAPGSEIQNRITEK